MRRRYLVGILAGWLLWGVLFAIGYGYLTGHGLLPGSIGFAAAVVAMPVSFGGWVYVWGDGPGQPPAWATTMWFSVVLGLVLYGALGMMVAAIYSRLRKTGLASRRRVL
jgi:hypothetical protein